MADPLLYNALDSYLYIDTQLAAATSQAQTAEANRAAKSVSAACCICCWCLCQAVKAACDTPLDPNIQQIIDENLFCWELLFVYQISMAKPVGQHVASIGQMQALVSVTRAPWHVTGLPQLTPTVFKLICGVQVQTHME